MTGRPGTMLLLLVSLFAALPLFAQRKTPAPAPERILAYHSTLTLRRDGRLLVTEKIRVHSTGETIRHGIYRDLSLAYRDSQGHPVRSDFRLTGVKRNGRPEESRLVRSEDGVRIYLGKKDALLAPGDYTYQLAYVTDRVVAFLRARDELYWDVTGHGWGFPIERAMARVLIPKAGAGGTLRANAEAGRAGTAGTPCRVKVSRGEVLVSSSKPLKPGEGMTVTVTLPKGLVRLPRE